MTDKETIQTSKFLSLILRHEPERVGLKLGEAGWVTVEELLSAIHRHGKVLTLEQLRHVVGTSDKKRFAFSEDGLRIRANQGHSVRSICNIRLRSRPRFCITARPRGFSIPFAKMD